MEFVCDLLELRGFRFKELGCYQTLKVGVFEPDRKSIMRRISLKVGPFARSSRENVAGGFAPRGFTTEVHGQFEQVSRHVSRRMGYILWHYRNTDFSSDGNACLGQVIDRLIVDPNENLQLDRTDDVRLEQTTFKTHQSGSY
jgi:hypothetical protein